MILHTDDSIVAIATPPGRGAISIVRLSGKEAFPSARKQLQLRGEPSARTAALGRFLDLQGESVDEVLVTFFPGPNSYTGEDLVEISCHGNPVVTQCMVNTFLGLGMRLAKPGEFTLRAVLHGRMDLLQAEAVQDLVESRTAFQAQQAAGQLRGRLSGSLAWARAGLLEVLCQLETGIEFVEDGLSLASRDELIGQLADVDRELKKLEESFQNGRVIRDGLQAVIVGKPNVGKSCLFNSLTGCDSAIVTAVPGTTRDALREVIELEGIPLTLVDTAGIRAEQNHSVEVLGVERSLRYLKDSDLVLFVLDRSAPFDAEDQRIWNEIGNAPYLLLLNKVDLAQELTVPEEVVKGSVAKVELSALHEVNLGDVRAEIANHACPGFARGDERPTMTRLRHKEGVEKARQEIGRARSLYSAGQGEEIVVLSLRKSLEALGELTGEVTTSEILDQVFANFCIGK